MKLISWNVNGLRACLKKGFNDWFSSTDADVICLQEVRATHQQLETFAQSVEDAGWSWHLNPAERPGYSGVATLFRQAPKSVTSGWDQPRFDNEGRVIVSDHGSFLLFNVYFPNGTSGSERLQYKMDFYESFLEHCQKLKKKRKQVVVCGDVNTAHQEIDLARPKANQDKSGFLPEERAWIDRFLKAGWVDSFRFLKPELEDCYSWWSQRGGARARNVGWRLDYFFVPQKISEAIVDASIEKDVTGSDHAPVSLLLDL